MDLGAEDIEQIVEHHMKQETITMRHRKDLAHRTARCDELNMEELFPGSTALNGCQFYQMKLSDEPPRSGSSSWPLSLRSEVKDRVRALRSELDELAIGWKVDDHFSSAILQSVAAGLGDTTWRNNEWDV